MGETEMILIANKVAAREIFYAARAEYNAEIDAAHATYQAARAAAEAKLDAAHASACLAAA